MEKYISKSALVSEIERRRDYYKRNPLLINAEYCIDEDNAILEFIDTIEVKEIGVDLGDPKGDKSAKYIIDTKTLEVEEVDLEKEWKEYFKYRGDVATVNIKHLAKHFFELGLHINNPITAADRGMA